MSEIIPGPDRWLYWKMGDDWVCSPRDWGSPGVGMAVESHTTCLTVQPGFIYRLESLVEARLAQRTLRLS